MSARVLPTILALMGLLASPQASALTSFAMLDAEQIVGGGRPSGSQGSGLSLGSMRLSDNRLTFFVDWADLTSNAISVSIHGPASFGEIGPAIWFDTWASEDERSATTGHSSGEWSGISAAQIQDLFDGLWYMQIATEGFTRGEIRGQIVTTGGSQITNDATHAPEPTGAAVFAVGLWVVAGAVKRRRAA